MNKDKIKKAIELINQGLGLVYDFSHPMPRASMLNILLKIKVPLDEDELNTNLHENSMKLVDEPSLKKQNDEEWLSNNTDLLIEENVGETQDSFIIINRKHLAMDKSTMPDATRINIAETSLSKALDRLEAAEKCLKSEKTVTNELCFEKEKLIEEIQKLEAENKNLNVKTEQADQLIEENVGETQNSLSKAIDRLETNALVAVYRACRKGEQR
ncbi:MAG: hypothetical protein JXA96_17230 [Sedimentisphaerales bacterium]|nr:hypothetical protein [Sedimentisphaerales bacterium]